MPSGLRCLKSHRIYEDGEGRRYIRDGGGAFWTWDPRLRRGQIKYPTRKVLEDDIERARARLDARDALERRAIGGAG